MTLGGMRSLAVGLVAVVALSGCGANDPDEDDADNGTPSESPSETATSESPDVEEEDELTEPGTQLELGDTATFKWNPTQRIEGHAAVAVTRIDQVSIKEFKAFKLSPEMEASTPYYVHVFVENLGTTDLGGRTLPLYMNDGSEVLIPSATIASSFEPCPSQPLPEKFPGGKRTELCLVYLAPEGRVLEAISLRSEELSAAITWEGEITEPGKGGKKNGKGKKGNSG